MAGLLDPFVESRFAIVESSVGIHYATRTVTSDQQRQRVEVWH
jgi:hypothetical protein